MAQAEQSKTEQDPAQALAWKIFVMTVLGIGAYVAAVIYFIG